MDSKSAGIVIAIILIIFIIIILIAYSYYPSSENVDNNCGPVCPQSAQCRVKNCEPKCNPHHDHCHVKSPCSDLASDCDAEAVWNRWKCESGKN